MRFVLLIVCFLGFSLGLQAQMNLIDDKGEKIVVYQDNSWHYSYESPEKAKSHQKLTTSKVAKLKKRELARLKKEQKNANQNKQLSPAARTKLAIAKREEIRRLAEAFPDSKEAKKAEKLNRKTQKQELALAKLKAKKEQEKLAAKNNKTKKEQVKKSNPVKRPNTPTKKETKVAKVKKEKKPKTPKEAKVAKVKKQKTPKTVTPSQKETKTAKIKSPKTPKEPKVAKTKTPKQPKVAKTKTPKAPKVAKTKTPKAAKVAKNQSSGVAKNSTSPKTPKAAKQKKLSPASYGQVLLKENDCKFAFDEVDKFKNHRKRGMENRLFFSHTDAALRDKIENNDYITCVGALSEFRNLVVLNLSLVIDSPNARKTFGYINSGSQVLLKLINGETVTLYAEKFDNGKVSKEYGITTYSTHFVLTDYKIKKLKEFEVSEVRIVWSTGYEDYPIYELDFFMDQLECLGLGK